MTLFEALRALDAHLRLMFNLEFKIIGQAAAELEAERWVPCSEAMPGPHEDVEVWCPVDDFGYCDICTWSPGEGFWRYVGGRDEDDEQNIESPPMVTHWRRVRGPR